jgi:hypothetical protein
MSIAWRPTGRRYRWVRWVGAAAFSAVFLLGPVIPSGMADILDVSGQRFYSDQETRNAGHLAENILIFDISSAEKGQNSLNNNIFWKQHSGCLIGQRDPVKDDHPGVWISGRGTERRPVRCNAYAYQFHKSRSFSKIYSVDIEGASIPRQVPFEFANIEENISAFDSRDVFGGPSCGIGGTPSRNCGDAGRSVGFDQIAYLDGGNANESTSEQGEKRSIESESVARRPVPPDAKWIVVGSFFLGLFGSLLIFWRMGAIP